MTGEVKGMQLVLVPLVSYRTVEQAREGTRPPDKKKAPVYLTTGKLGHRSVSLVERRGITSVLSHSVRAQNNKYVFCYPF